MYAIVEDSGTQIKVAEGDIIDIDVRDLEKDAASITFDRVLALKDGDGSATLGTPYIDGMNVTAEILEERLGEKIDVIKFKRRKGYKRKQGHRQKYLRVRISGIGATKKKKKKTTTSKKSASKKVASTESEAD
ncbi:MAG: 50S ribosomal protein L21 [Planctomycetota bacterium]|nr:50S ribosomal protein L21 [Planctomycetota bacterium]